MNYLILFFKYYCVIFIIILSLITYSAYMRIKKKKKPIGALIVAITLIIYLVLQIGSYEIKVGKEIHENNLLGLKIQEISFVYYTATHDGE